MNGIREYEPEELEYGMDFRLPQYRRALFLRMYEFHCKYKSHPGCVYYLLPHLFKELEMDEEQKLWFCFINGCCQHPLTSYYIWWHFRDLKSLNINDLETWFNERWSKMGWDMDRRYVKAKFIKCVKSYQKNLEGRLQSEFFRDYNFTTLWGKVMEDFDYFGRLSTFSYLEYLRIAGLPIECDSLFLWEMEGSKSHRNGLCKVLGRDDLDWHSSNPTFQAYDDETLTWLADEGEKLLKQSIERFQAEAGYFTLESTLCAFKGMFRVNRRYPNVYNDMLRDRIVASEVKIPEFDFSIFWEAREWLPKHLRVELNPKDPGLKPEKQNHFRLTGQPVMMDEEWPCFRNDFNDRIR